MNRIKVQESEEYRHKQLYMSVRKSDRNRKYRHEQLFVCLI